MLNSSKHWQRATALRPITSLFAGESQSGICHAANHDHRVSRRRQNDAVCEAGRDPPTSRNPPRRALLEAWLDSVQRREWKEKLDQLIQGERWILDGNYGGTMDMRVAAADTVVFLDLPRSVCLYRVFKRIFQYLGRTRPDLADGCLEQLPDLEFLRWIWTYPEVRAPKVLSMLASHADKTTVVLRSTRDVEQFLGGVA